MRPIGWDRNVSMRAMAQLIFGTHFFHLVVSTSLLSFSISFTWILTFTLWIFGYVGSGILRHFSPAIWLQFNSQRILKRFNIPILSERNLIRFALGRDKSMVAAKNGRKRMKMKTLREKKTEICTESLLHTYRAPALHHYCKCTPAHVNANANVIKICHFTS